jgi:hypothetical protein
MENLPLDDVPKKKIIQPPVELIELAGGFFIRGGVLRSRRRGRLLQQQSAGVLLSFILHKFVIAKQIVSSQKEEQTRK